MAHGLQFFRASELRHRRRRTHSGARLPRRLPPAHGDAGRKAAGSAVQASDDMKAVEIRWKLVGIGVEIPGFQWFSSTKEQLTYVFILFRFNFFLLASILHVSFRQV